MKPTIIRYAIPGNESGGLLHIYGEGTASNVILYCGGWPDGVEPFTSMAMRLATSGSTDTTDGCFVGVTCWPGFDFESYQQLKFRGFKRGGYNFNEVLCCIREAAKQLFVEYYRHHADVKDKLDTPQPQFTVIFHDFGVLPGLMFVNRSIEEDDFAEHTPNRIVLLDVLLEPHPHFKPQFWYLSPYSVHELLVYLVYRGTFACAFAMLRFLSESIGLLTFRIMYMFVVMLRLAPLHPRCSDMMLLEERKMDHHHLIYTFYPYYYLFRAMLFNKKELVHGCLPLNLVKTPILYLYGEEKNVMFHDHRSFAILQQEERDGTSDCRVVKVKGAGHWMYCQRPEVCEAEIRKFLNVSMTRG